MTWTLPAGATRRALPWLLLALMIALPDLAWGQATIPGITSEPTAGGGQQW